METLPFLLNADLSRGYTVSQVAEKHRWDDYLKILEHTGWLRTHIIQAPLSSERFEAGVVSAMQKKKILGGTSRYVIILNQVG